ncbi:hypothetical protein AWU82_29570 [Pseudomonas glycinae]|uniref:Uncharacterized protein n=1 Tax=Pseudomonas glycinae TaxID=1785145 RepID=A0ABN5FRU8_9PSED|nr:hypothetical protein AWU82_29570 [Pseudomonas glycinae]
MKSARSQAAPNQPHTDPPTLIVPTLCVGMPQWTLCVRFGTRSVPGCVPTRTVRRLDVGTIRDQQSGSGICRQAA